MKGKVKFVELHGWEVYFHRNLFGQQRRQLKEQANQLKIKLPPTEFVKHPTVRNENLLSCAFEVSKQEIHVCLTTK